MDSKVSYTSFDYKNTELIPVIASFDDSGHIRPLYVRINDKAYHVHSYWVKYAFSNITQFQCKIEDQDTLRPLLLSYYHREGVWGIDL